MLRDLSQDARQAARMLRTRPGFAAAAVVTLALGIGATTAIFSVIHSVLLRPLPFPDPDELVNVVHNVNGADLAYFSDPVYLAYVENSQTFREFGVWSAGTATVTGRGEPEQVRTLVVSPEVLPALGMRPDIGRWFSSEDSAPGTPRTVMLTRAFWQRRFGADRGALERALTINAQQHLIIGVMPAAFRFGGEPDVIVLQRIVRPGLRAFRHQGVARLKTGVTLAQANADVARMIPIWFKDTGANASRFAPSLRPLKQDVVGDVGKTLWVLMGTIGTSLLMGGTLEHPDVQPLYPGGGDCRSEAGGRGVHAPRRAPGAHAARDPGEARGHTGGRLGSVHVVSADGCRHEHPNQRRHGGGGGGESQDTRQPADPVFLPARLHTRIFGLPGYLARQVSVTIRSERAGTESFLEQVHEAVWSVNATLPLAKVRTLGDVYDRSMARTSFTLVLLAIAGAMALLLSICGIYGVISYAVSQRRREIGIRLALGAQAREIRGLFVRRGLVVTGIGVAVGLGAAAAFTRLMRSLLFGISPLDPITFAAVPIVLAAAAVLASYLPARRAVAVDPVETLRAE